MGKLTGKQERFVQEYLKDYNATQAAIRAGYSAKTAYSIGNENLSKPEILEAVEAGQKKAQVRCNITVDEVLKTLKEIRDRGLQETETIDTINKNYGQYPGSETRKVHNLQAAAKATELMGKHIGMFKEHEGPATGPVTIVLQLPEGIQRGEGNQVAAQGPGREAVQADENAEDPPQ